jgi:hypothetical protein
MALAPINPTQLTPPRVAFIDERSGAISREWYRFFLSLLTATQTNQDEVELAPDAISLLATYDAMLAELAQATESAPDCCVSGEAVLASDIQGLASTPLGATVSALAAVQSEVQALALSPPPLDELAIRALNPSSTAPVTKTADFTVAPTETWIINNKSGSTCTVTLPSAATYSGRYLTFQNNQAQTLVSASSDVVPQGGGAAGTAILTDVSGNWATLVSNGTNWVIMQAASFNTLLY